ncbi:hypothetical protein [Aquabacterium sp.]|uniref:hypothetical protein n=1 Tax=Aquabacterium sp. TaxID=1872578 RepID=UPI0025C6945D|nr:hypothetical protein [Aquabacterium sp.]
MDPISTFTLAAAMLVAAPATRKQIFDCQPEAIKKEFIATDTVFLLPGNVAQPAAEYLIKIGSSPKFLSVSHREMLKREVGAYSDLTDGWNGPGTMPPPHEILDVALNMIDAIPARLPLPRPMISASGEIGLYWDLAGGYAEVGFDPNGEVTFFSRDQHGVERFENLRDLMILEQSWFWDRLGPFDSPAKEAA